MTAPLISVCIPCHNAGSYIGDALNSVLDQTWPNVEIIVVEDNSSDDSRAIVSSFQDRGVKLISAQLGNAAKARNRALSEARGDFIKFFDADDLMNSNMLSSQMERIAQQPGAVATSKWGRFYDDDFTTFTENPETVWRDMTPSDWLTEAWRAARPMMQPGIFLIPATVLRQSGPWNESLSLIDDFEFFSRVLCQASEVKFADEGILYYRSGLSSSLSGRKSRPAIESASHSLLLGTEHLLALRDDASTRRSCANMLQDFIYTYYPTQPDLRAKLAARITALGGSDLEPTGAPRFEQLSRIVGWKLARRIQSIRDRWSSAFKSVN